MNRTGAHHHKLPMVLTVQNIFELAAESENGSLGAIAQGQKLLNVVGGGQNGGVLNMGVRNALMGQYHGAL